MGTTSLGGHMTTQHLQASVTAAQVEAVDTVLASIYVPGDATIYEVILNVTDMDSGSTLTVDVGDTDDDERYISAFSGQSQNTIRASHPDGIYTRLKTYSVAGEQEIQLTVRAAATTGVAGTVTLTVVHFNS